MPDYSDDCRQYLVNKDHGIFGGFVYSRTKIYQYMRLIHKFTPVKHFLFLSLMQLSKCSPNKETRIKLQVK